MEAGDIIVNFKLVKRIDSLDEFMVVLKRDKSFYARHKVYPTAFFFSWHIALVYEWMNSGWFWTIEKNN